MGKLILRDEELASYPDVAEATHPTSEIAAGSWKALKPVLNEKLAPCTLHCPLMIKIPHVLDKLSSGQVEAAARIMFVDNPFAELTGRLCPAPCESVCNRGHLDDTIAIKELERFLGDKVLELKEKQKPLKPTGKKVAIIGSGPAGMMASYLLASRGHKVTIFERKGYLGGSLRSLVPHFKLSRDILDKNFEILGNLGVEFKVNSEVSPDDLEELSSQFDALLILVGQTSQEELEIEGKELTVNGLNLLEKLLNSEYSEMVKEYSGRRVLIFGEVGTSIDLARTLVRLNAFPLLIIKESIETITPSLKRELLKAKEEGVEIQGLSSVSKVTKRDDNKLEVLLSGVRAIESYRGVNVHYLPISEGTQKVVADIVAYIPTRKLASEWIQKLNIDPDKLLKSMSFRVKDNIFIGGSALLGPTFISESLAQGKAVANEVLSFLAGRAYKPPQTIKPVVTYENIVKYYFEEAPRMEYKIRPAKERVRDFNEEYLPYELEEVMREAERCFSCGHCNSCGNCWIFCPDNAIQWVGAPKFIYDACKGCGICAAECPRNVIDMVPV